jgi:hypothetical protein
VRETAANKQVREMGLARGFGNLHRRSCRFPFSVACGARSDVGFSTLSHDAGGRTCLTDRFNSSDTGGLRATTRTIKTGRRPFGGSTKFVTRKIVSVSTVCFSAAVSTPCLRVSSSAVSTPIVDLGLGFFDRVRGQVQARGCVTIRRENSTQWKMVAGTAQHF